eukprot:9500209-Pyramimonas_sp.AAC.1
MVLLVRELLGALVVVFVVVHVHGHVVALVVRLAGSLVRGELVVRALLDPNVQQGAQVVVQVREHLGHLPRKGDADVSVKFAKPETPSHAKHVGPS